MPSPLRSPSGSDFNSEVDEEDNDDDFSEADSGQTTPTQPTTELKQVPEVGLSEELERFRAEWRAEVNRRKAGRAKEGPTIYHSESDNAQSLNIPATAPSTSTSLDRPRTAVSTEGFQEFTSSKELPRKTQTALDLYRRAVEHEQRSELEDSHFLLYRQAFRLESNIDRIYYRLEMVSNIVATQKATAESDNDMPLPTVIEIEAHNKPKVALSVPLLTGPLIDILNQFPEVLTFEKEDEKEQDPALNMLPNEVLIHVLHMLDPSNLEKFAMVNRKARVLTLDSELWRDLVLSTYKPPQLNDPLEMAPIIEDYKWDYRRVFIEHPRVRLDGVYIAVCHYVRPGLSDNVWVNVSHLITYHRYLRFYPNGQVLSLLANGEEPPGQIIPLLKPSLKMKGLFVGTWALRGDMIILENLIDASGRYIVPTSGIPERLKGASTSASASASSSNALETLRYVFTMALALKSKPIAGRWNRLDITSYDSVNLETGDINPVALKHERPFWFSKVRSYGNAY